MKKIFTIFAMLLCINLVCAENNQYKDTYEYGIYEIDRELLIKNLRSNVAGYIKHNGWYNDKVSDFQNAYNEFMKALAEPRRLYSDDFGTIFDITGRIKGDKELYWYDSNGHKISNSQYDSLKKKYRNQYHRFHPYSEFVKYFNTIAKAVLKHTGKQ